MITLEGSKNVIGQGLITFSELLIRLQTVTDALKQAEIDQGVGEGVEIGDSVAIAKMGTFNAQSNCLAIDAFGGRALRVNIFVGRTLPVERITQARANTGWHGNRATALASTFVVNGTRLFNEFVLHAFGKERTDILATLMFNEGDCAVGVSEKKGHGYASLANWQSLRVELAVLISTLFGERHCGKGRRIVRTMEVLVDIKSIKSGIKRAESGSKSQSLLGLLHQREEVRNIWLIESLRFFSQDELTPRWHFHNHHA